MPRIQILELPTVPHENGLDETPFAVIIDQLGTEESADHIRQDIRDHNLAEALGARHVLAFQDTIDIPANDTSPFIAGYVGEGHLVTQLDPPKAGPLDEGEPLTDPDRIPNRYA